MPGAPHRPHGPRAEKQRGGRAGAERPLGGLAPAPSLREGLGAGWKGSQQGTDAGREEQAREQVGLGLQHTANAVVVTQP